MAWWLLFLLARAEEPDPILLTGQDANSCPAREVWPDGAWPTAAADPAAVAALDAYLFPPGLDRADPDRVGIRTDGVVIVRGGAVVYERYGPGWDASRPHLAWSASKTFLASLIGIAEREGRLDVEASVCTYVPDLPPASCVVTVRHLLEMASGFDWRETYEGFSPRASSVLAMLYGEGSGDMGRFAASHPFRDPPGTTWMYSSGDANVLALVAGAVLAPVHGEHYPWVLLFDRLGITSAVWERDGVGTYVGSSYVSATVPDLARFGYLWLNDGCWRGERILPEGWVARSTKVNAAFLARPLAWDPGDVYGWQVWLNRPVPEVGQPERPWSGAPEDAYAARGHWKQSITVVPSADAVVVRVADDRDDTFDMGTFLGLALAVEAR